MTTVRPKTPGLRERKKARTREAIQEAALRLFAEQGYAATTVRQIAEAAQVSQQTFFRYFPTKADTVLYDRTDPLLVEAFLRQPAELRAIPALRAALREVYSALPPASAEADARRIELLGEVGDVPILVRYMRGGTALLVDATARRTGRDPEDPELQALVGAVIGVAITAYLSWSHDPGGPTVFERWDAILAMLEDGLQL